MMEFENRLRRYLELADKQNLFGRGWSDSASSYDPSGRRLEWAMSQARQGDSGNLGDSRFFDEGELEPQQPANIRNRLMQLMGRAR